jgi:hypothetical protein
MAPARGGEGRDDDVDGRGRRREEEKTVALCGARISLRGERSVRVKSPFSVTPLDWVFQHWSPRNVTSRHKDCLTKRAVGEHVVGRQARKYSLPHRSHKLIYKIYNVAQLSKLLLLQLKCYVKRFS